MVVLREAFALERSPKTQGGILTSRGWHDQREAVVRELLGRDGKGSVDARGNNGVRL